MSLISISHLTFVYENSFDNIFTDVSVEIDTDWKLGLVGRNGRGKTTLLNLLMGKYEYTGNIFSSVNFEYFPYEVKRKDQITLDLINNINNKYAFWQLQKELSQLDISEDILYNRFNILSGGEQMKILLATLFLKENYFLLIDEPTNHLDLKTREIVSNYLKTKKGFILVSHDRVFIDNCVDHILSINKTCIELQKGNLSSYNKNKQKNIAFEFMQNEKLKKDIKRMTDSAKRTSDWSYKIEKTKYGKNASGLKSDKGYVGHKAAKMMKRSKVIEARRNLAIVEKSNLLKDVENSEKLKISPLNDLNKLISFNNIALFYDDKIVCNNVTFKIERGDRIAITGKNGAGKTTILKLIRGLNIRYTGSFEKSSNLVISYVSQDTSLLRGTVSDFAVTNNVNESLFKTILRKFGFERIQFEKDMCDFSEGQKKKVLISKSLSEVAHIYVWDEPLNFVDIISRVQIEELLLEYKPTILFIEHDAAFIKNVASKIVEL